MIEQTFLLEPQTSSQALTSGALTFTTSFNRRFRLLGVYLKASENITETVTVTKDMNAGATYDTQLDTENLSSAQNYVFRPTGKEVFEKGDQVKVQCTNANTTGTVYVSVYAEEVAG